MTFIDPHSGLIAAAIAGPTLLILYLLRLRRRPLRVSSTLLWDQAVKDLQVNVPFRWLRPSVIFFLQLAALAAFVIALARPAIQGPAPVADQVVIIIDHTASMSAAFSAAETGDVKTRLDAAKYRARQYVGQLARSSGISGGRPMIQVVSAAGHGRIRCAPTSDTREAIDQIESIEPTDQAGEGGEPGVSAAIRMLLSAAAKGEESIPQSRPEVVAFSDAPLPADAAAIGARLVSVAGTDQNARDNAGVVALNARRDSADPGTIHVFARLQSASPQPRPLAVRLLVNGELALAREVTVPASPGDAPVSLSIKHAEACTLIVTIDTPDVLAADNTAAVQIDAASSPAILVVAPATGDNPDPDPFLIGALESLRPRQLRTVTQGAYERECAEARTDGRRPWRAFDLIVFDRIEPAAAPPQPTLSFGAGLPIDGLRLAKTDHPSSLSASRFSTWRRAHPVLRYVSLDAIVVAPPPPVIDIDAAAETPAASSIVALAFGPTASSDNAAIIAALSAPGRPDSPRRIVVSFSLARSNWGPDHSFPVFISNAVEALTGLGGATSARSWTTSEPVVIRPVESAREVLVFAAEGGDTIMTRVQVPLTSEPSEPLNLGVFPRSGVYRFSGCEQPVACINLLASSETLLPQPRPSPANATRAVPPEVAGARSNEPTPGQREVWHWFLLIGVGLASVEWVLFAHGMRG